MSFSHGNAIDSTLIENRRLQEEASWSKPRW